MSAVFAFELQATDGAARSGRLTLAHGSVDPVISLAMAAASRDQLLALDYAVEWREYPMPHSVYPEEIQDIARWLRKTLAPGK